MGTTVPLQIKLITQLLMVSTRNTSKSNANPPRIQDPPGDADSRPPGTLEAMQANTSEVEALRLTNQRLIGELEQLTWQMQHPREARHTQEGHNIPPHEGQHNLDIPRGVETEAESSRARGHGSQLAPEEEGIGATLGGRVGNEELHHPQQGAGEQSWEQRFKSLQQELSRVKKVVRGRAPDTMDTLVQQTESPFIVEVFHFPLPAKSLPSSSKIQDATSGSIRWYQRSRRSSQHLQKPNGVAWVSRPCAMQSFRYHTKRPSLGLVQQTPALINCLIQRAIHCVHLPLHWIQNIQKAKLSPTNHQAELARKHEVLCPEVQCRVSEGRYIRREVRSHRIHRWIRSAVERLDVFHLKKPSSKHGRGAL